MVFNLIQALQETRALSEDHPDDPAWQQLRSRIDEVIGELTEDADDPTTEVPGADRLVRPEIDETHTELAAAALMAVHDRPEEEQLELARAAVEDLADEIVN